MQAHDGNKSFVSWFGLVVCLLACGYYFIFFFNRAHVEIDITVSQKTDFKLYWAGEGEGFSEKRRAVVRLTPDQQRYHFYLTNLGRVDKLRIDPMEHQGEAVIRDISLTQKRFKPITIDLSRIGPANDIGAHTYDERGLCLQATGNDPYFLVVPEMERTAVSWWEEGAIYVLIFLAVLVVIGVCAPLRHNFAYVPVMLAMAFVLVVVMAGISKQNAHPDEYVHLRAAAYYGDNWLPPRIDDPAIENTYSVYGVSRLNNGEIYYLFAGKLARLAQAFHVPELLSLRLLNVVLFGLIVLYAVYSLPARLVALPFLLSPGIWYLFSYCVSDAFGLFICFIVACEMVRPESRLNRFLFGEQGGPAWGTWLYLPILLALLLLLKINYYPFIAFAAIVVFWRIYRLDNPGLRREALVKIATVIVLAGIVAGMRIGADYYVNGPDRQQNLAAIQEKTAHPWYKPSTELHKKHISLFLKERGTSLTEIITKHRWFEHTLYTGIGVYGYFTIGAPPMYYDLVKWLLAIFSLLVVGTLLLRGTAEIRLFTLLAILLSAALLGASLHRSWTIDFQAQGRYLFPILPLFGLLLGRTAGLFNNRLMILCLTHLFILSCYSFVFVALAAIPRIAG